MSLSDSKIIKLAAINLRVFSLTSYYMDGNDVAQYGLRKRQGTVEVWCLTLGPRDIGASPTEYYWGFNTQTTVAKAMKAHGLNETVAEPPVEQQPAAQ